MEVAATIALGENAVQLHDYVPAQRHLQKAAAIATELKDYRTAARAHEMLAKCHHRQGSWKVWVPSLQPQYALSATGQVAVEHGQLHHECAQQCGDMRSQSRACCSLAAE